MSSRTLTELIANNPLWVLGLGPEATALDVERAGEKILGGLALGLKSAASVQTPLGPLARDENTVREAMRQLRDDASATKAREVLSWATRAAQVKVLRFQAPAPPTFARVAVGFGRPIVPLNIEE